jgi:hypothetical protein
MTARTRSVADERLSEMRLGTALRRAGEDLYFNSWRLVPANLAWAAVVAAVGIAAWVWLPAALLVGLAGIPLAGIQRMAGLIARGESASFGDFVDGARRTASRAAALGLGATILAVAFSSNILFGLALDTPFGWFLMATAAYADVALAMVLLAAWPILADPSGESRPLREVVRLAGVLCLTTPRPLFGLTATVAALLVATTVILPAIALVGIAYTSLVSARYVLPLVDRFEAVPVAGAH